MRRILLHISLLFMSLYIKCVMYFEWLQLMNEDMGQQQHQETATALPYPQQPQPQINLGRHILGGFPVSTFPMALSPGVLPVSGETSSVDNLTSSIGPNLNLQNDVPQQAKGAPTTLSAKLIRPIPLHPVLPPPSSKMAGLNLNNKYTQPPTRDPSPLSLKLATTSSEEQSPNTTSSHSSAFQGMSSGSDSIISVA